MEFYLYSHSALHSGSSHTFSWKGSWAPLRLHPASLSTILIWVNGNIKAAFLPSFLSICYQDVPWLYLKHSCWMPFKRQDILVSKWWCCLKLNRFKNMIRSESRVWNVFPLPGMPAPLPTGPGPVCPPGFKRGLQPGQPGHPTCLAEASCQAAIPAKQCHSNKHTVLWELFITPLSH